MTIKYAVLNPGDGQYEFVETIEEVNELIARRALAFYMTHGHGVQYNTVEIDPETGWETWHANSPLADLNEENLLKLIKKPL